MHDQLISEVVLEDNMRVYAERLRALLDAHPQHQGNVSSLARAAKLPQPTVSRIVSGKSANPHADSLAAIARALGVTEDQIFDGSNTPIQAVTGKRIACPILDWSAISMDKGRPKIDASNPQGWAYSPVGGSDRTFIMLAENDAMYPMIQAGDTLFVDPARSHKGGDVVLAFAEGENRPVLRRLLMDGSDMLLEADNEAWSKRSLRLKSAKHVVGVVSFYGRRP